MRQHTDPAVRDLIAEAERRGAIKALHDMADQFRTRAADAWGASRGWYTTGAHVADLAAAWCEEAATEDYGGGETA